MKKLYIWGWESPSQIQTIEESNNQIVRWFSNKEGSKDSLDKIIYRPREIDKNLNTLPNELVNIINQEFRKFSDMYSRVNYSKGLTTQELLHIFNLYLRYFYTDLKKHQPEFVLFSSFPHFGVDYTLYLTAKALNIKTIILFQTLFPNRFFAVDSLEDFVNVHQQKEHSKNSQSIEKSFKKELFYMKKIKNKNKKCIFSLISDSLQLLRARSKPLSLTGVVRKLQDCKHFNRHFFKNTIKKIDREQKYVYFPLQLQPEMTTSMLGGIYSDQLLALEQLSQLLPDDWKIYVKENPKQKAKQRGVFFFKRLKSIPKVQYLSQSINTHYLIKHSQFVSVITGTAGWEAISGGQKVLIFGFAWYNSLPGVFKYNKDINIDTILSYRISHTQLELDLNHLLNRAYEGVSDPNYNQLVENYSDEKNKESLLKFLKKILI